jgi:hypothetical protein
MKSRFFPLFFLWLKIFRIRNIAFQASSLLFILCFILYRGCIVFTSAEARTQVIVLIQLIKVSPVQNKNFFFSPCKSGMAAGWILRHLCSFLGTLCSFFLLFYAQSIEWFTEDQAFLRLYDSTPHTRIHPLQSSS